MSDRHIPGVDIQVGEPSGYVLGVRTKLGIEVERNERGENRCIWMLRGSARSYL